MTFLDVYSDPATDGSCGGTPHFHTVSTEAYIVIGGTGVVQTIDAAGFHETALHEGVVVWFTPGTVHRAVNIDGLRIVVLMSNAGLPEAGDAVMTFPASVLTDADAYRAASMLPPASDPTIAERARVRRDLAVDGFVALRSAIEQGDDRALDDLYAAAAVLVRDRAGGWPDIVRVRPAAQAQRSLGMAAALARGDATHLLQSRTSTAEARQGEKGYGMCGRLRTYSVDDPTDTASSAPEAAACGPQR